MGWIIFVEVMTTARFKLLLCTLAVCLSAGGQNHVSGYGLDKENVMLVYVRNNADGTVEWRHTVHVVDVKDLGNTVRYTTESYFTKANGKPLYKSAMCEFFNVEKETGNIMFDMSATMVSYIKGRVGINATSSGIMSGFPSTLEPGDMLDRVSGQAKVGPLTYTVTVDERKVLRHETIQVPAGKFDCVVVQEHKVESGPGHNRDVLNISWYSKGIGYVRHDTYIKGKLDTSEILESMK